MTVLGFLEAELMNGVIIVIPLIILRQSEGGKSCAHRWKKIPSGIYLNAMCTMYLQCHLYYYQKEPEFMEVLLWRESEKTENKRGDFYPQRPHILGE